MTTDTDTYAMLDTRDWGHPQPQVLVSSTRNGRRQPRPRTPHRQQEELQYGELSLKSLNKDWHGVIRNIGNIGSVLTEALYDWNDIYRLLLDRSVKY